MNANNVIEETFKETPYFDLCISFLQADPRSLDADVRGLALIMLDVASTKAKETLDHIKDLIKISPKEGEKQALDSCVTYYDFGIITTDIPTVTESLKSGFYDVTEEYINDVFNEADLCEKRFKAKSPLTEMNKVVHDVAVVAAPITKILISN